jgi:hypothetical protein
MIQTDFALAFFKGGLDRPAHAAEPNEFSDRHIGGRVSSQ